MPAATQRRTVKSRLARGNLLTSLVLVFPLFLAYQAGVMLAPDVGNGADILTGALWAAVGHSSRNYLLANLGLAAAFLVLVLALRTRQKFDFTSFGPVILESAVYAVTMGSLILHVMGLLGIHPRLAVGDGLPASAITRVALAIGAGVNEELVFRLILLGGSVALLSALGVKRWFAVLLGFVVTSVLFSAAHHVIGGEPWRTDAFTFRFLCGLLFAALYQWRGFAVAVYTHALYDIYVMVIR